MGTEDSCQTDITLGTTDTNTEINPKLIHLMDTLYQYILQDYTDKDFNINI